MGKFKKLTLLLLYILFFVTYSKAPPDSTVEQLIAAQYKEGNKIMQAAKTNASNNKNDKMAGNGFAVTIGWVTLDTSAPECS